jgi:hypothetical protein
VSDVLIQGYIQDLIQGTSTFTDAAVTRGDFLLLGTGKPAPPYAVILPGEVADAKRAGDWAQVQIIWEHEVDVFQRLLDDDYSDFVTAQQAVVDVIGQNPTLGGKSGISKALVVRSVRDYVYPKGGADVPAFVFARMTVRTVEEVSYAGSGEFTT